MQMPLTVVENRSLTELNTFGLPARAHRFVDVDDWQVLQAVRADEALAQLPRLVLGGGSNILLKGDFPGLVVHMVNRGTRVSGETAEVVLVTAAAGENWHEFVCWTLANDLPGLENLSLIPGSVGAAPIQNIGAYGVEVKDLFHSLRMFDMHTGQVFGLTREDCDFAYRDSIFKHALRDRAVILDVTFALPRAWQARLAYAELAAELKEMAQPTPQQVADAVIAVRRRKLPDPAKVGNAGSFFKNPVVSAERRDALAAAFPGLPSYAQPDGSYKLAAGWLIDQCGWKGKSIGPAGVYEKQALVLVNRGGATGSDILALARAIHEDVFKRYGVMLEPEPVLVPGA
jgi:UDP-N-acetylmuramate dehydrogenase